MSDVLLLNLPFTGTGYSTINKFASRSIPVGLASLSGALRARGIAFDVLDADALGLDIDKTIAIASRKNPRIIGMSTYTAYSEMTRYAVSEIKKANKNIIVVLGGHHAFAAQGELLKSTEADIIAIGEGENIFPQLCDVVLGGRGLENTGGIYFKKNDSIRYTGNAEYIGNLDSLPIPAYDRFPMDRYEGHFYRRWTAGYRKPFANIVTSRGCPFSCGFCSNVMWGKKMRFQSPERVLIEVDYLVKNYGVRQMSFFDDIFTVDTVRVHRICDLIMERGYRLDLFCSTRVDVLNEKLVRKMYSAGFRWIGVGIESGNQAILKKISKGQTPEKCSRTLKMIADNGIAIYGSVIFGYPGEDKKTLRDTLSFLLKNPVHLPQLNVFVPYPGTPVYNELIEQGVDIPNDMHQFTKVVSYNHSIPAWYLTLFYWYSYIRILARLRYINLIRKAFIPRLVFADFVGMAWAFIRRTKKKRPE